MTDAPWELEKRVQARNLRIAIHTQGPFKARLTTTDLQSGGELTEYFEGETALQQAERKLTDEAVRLIHG